MEPIKGVTYHQEHIIIISFDGSENHEPLSGVLLLDDNAVKKYILFIFAICVLFFSSFHNLLVIS